MNSALRTALVVGGMTASFLTGLLVGHEYQLNTEKKFEYRQDLNACGKNSALPWCIATPNTGTNESIEIVNSVEAKARAHFTYNPDLLDLQDWTSHMNDVNKGKGWEGICNDLVFTEFDMLASAGFPTNKMWRILVSLDGKSDVPDHMIGIVQVGDKYYVVGDVGSTVDMDGRVIGDHTSPYLVSGLKYRILRVNRVDSGIFWYAVDIK